LPLPNLGEPGSGNLLPKSGEKEPAKNPDLDKPAGKPSDSLPLKPALPSSPGDFVPPKSTAPSGTLRQRRGAVAAGSAEPGSNASQQDERSRDPKLVETSFEQRDTAAKRTIHNALDGFCPVELREKEKWVAGRSDLRASYQGQVFRFSSEAARRRFAAAPEKYAPANGGYDAVLAMEENRDVSGSIQHSAVWQGRLYLFASSANLAAFREDPTRYAKRPISSTEAHGVSEKHAAAESSAVKHPPKSEEPQRLRLPGDSL
jgi:YHS domain-containing protein